MELAYLISEAPIIGVTGSNGETTTTSMIGGKLTALMGNEVFYQDISATASQRLLK